MSTKRADILLVDEGLVKSRSHAKDLIEEGVVFYNGVPLKKASQKVSIDGLEIKKENIYASRGAHKVEGALKAFEVDPTGMVVADVGASTGGFTDYVLRNGASYVYAIDVGHDQLAPELCADSRVENLEGTNIRYPLELDQKVDLAVVDLSFISLRLTFETIFSLVRDGGKVVALVKPQFEAGKARIGKNGIVSEENRIETIEELAEWMFDNGYPIQAAIKSPITGKTGNVEYFFYFEKGNLETNFNKEILREL